MLVWTGCWLCECLGNCSFYAIDFSPLNFLSTYIPGKILCDLSWHPARHTKRFAACRLLMEINRQCVWRNHAFGKNQGQFTQRNFHLMSCSCWVIWLAVLAIWQGHPQAQYCGSSPCYGTYVLPDFFLLPFRWQLLLIFDLEVDLLSCLFVCLFVSGFCYCSPGLHLSDYHRSADLVLSLLFILVPSMASQGKRTQLIWDFRISVCILQQWKLAFHL